MPNPSKVRKQRLRMTKAQFIDEIDTLEQRAAALEAANRSSAPMRAGASDRYLANQQLADLARFTSENPNPVLRVMPDGTVLYANDAAIAVKGLLKGRKKSTLAGDLAGICAEASGTAEVRETEFESGDRVFAFSIAPVAGETYVNIYGRDITERKRAEEALRLTEQHRAIINLAATEGSYDWDITKDTLDISPRLNEIFGFEQSELTSKDWVARVHADDLEIYRLALVRHFKQETGVLECEYRIRDKAGGGRWISDRAIAQTDDQGRAVRLIGAISDITERKRAEEELRAQSAILEATMENMGQGISMFDRNLNTVAFNKKFFELMEFPEERFGRGFSMEDAFRFNAERGEYGPGDVEDQVRERVELSRKFLPHRFERTRPDGTVLEIAGNPIEGGGFVTTYTDITERKRAEEELRAQSAILEATMENMGQGISMFDRNLNTVAFNKKFFELMEFPEERFGRGFSMEDAFRFNAERGEYGPGDVEDQVRERVELSRKFLPHRFERTRPDGTVLEIAGNPIEGGGFVTTYTDITERKRAEEELAKKEAQLRLALDHMPGGMLLADRDLNYVLFNARYSELFEFPDGLVRVGGSSRDGFRYQADRGDLGPGDPDKLIEEVVANYRRGEAVSYERAIAGSGRTLQVYLAPTPEGGYVTIATDITERKRAEEALRKSEERLSTILETSPVGVSITDSAKKRIVVNQRYADLIGAPRKKLLGGHIMNVWQRAEDREEYARRFAMDGRVVDMEFELRRVDGSSLWVMANAISLEFSGEPVRVNWIVDLSDRKRAEGEIRKSREQLQALADNLPEFISMKDSEERFIFVNKRFEEWICQSRDDVIGKTVFDIYSDDQANEFHALDRQVIDSREVLSEEIDLPYPDGKTRAIIRTRFPVISSKGEMLGLGTVNHDITERKAAEDALREAKRRSEEASKLVAEKNRMLESLSSQLSKYLSPQVYASIFSGEQSVEIASKRKKLTVFFSDIADFTGTTDSLESEELTNLLNHYLTEMSKIASDHGATIDKYVGDSIVAFFGDPETKGVKEDAKACVNMAIAMQRRMRELQSEWLDMGLEKPFELRIGINTGFCTVGNFGSADRMDYTIIGNEVNLAARLESLAEVGGILMAHETHSLVKDTVLTEEGDALTVKGFAKPVRTYSVVGLYDDLAEQGRIIRRDQEGLALKIDREKLTKKGKAEAIKAIKDALSQLED